MAKLVEDSAVVKAKAQAKAKAPATKFAFSTDVTAIHRMVESIESRSKGIALYYQHVHAAMCSAMIHCALHRDSTLIQRIDDAMPNGSYRNGLRQFVNAKGPVSYNLGDKKQKIAAHWQVDDKKQALLKAKFETAKAEVEKDLMSVPYWDFAPEKQDFEGLSIPAMLRRVYAQVQRTLKDPAKKEDKRNDLTGLKELEKIVADLPPAPAKA